MPLTIACTSLAVNDKNNNWYQGRTLEFTDDSEPSCISYFPVGHQFTSMAPDGTSGLVYTATQPFMSITMSTVGVLKAINTHFVLQGMNQAGLVFSLNMKPDSDLQPLGQEDYATALSIVDLGSWSLSQFTSVNEVKAALADAKLWSPMVNMLHGSCPFHYAFYDAKGGSIVVEISNKTLHVYDNPSYCMTNGPDFPWHLTNLNNYSHLTNKDQSTGTLRNIPLRQPDSGIALSALPCSDTSVDRFVRAVFYSNYIVKADTPDAQIIELSHVMNRFDRPKNVSVSFLGEGTASEVEVTEFTTWTTLTDFSRGLMYFRSYHDLNYTCFSFEQFKDEKEAVTRVLV